MQLRWNALHSLAVVAPWTCSEAVVAVGSSRQWLPLLFKAVLAALSSENFKVHLVIVWCIWGVGVLIDGMC